MIRRIGVIVQDANSLGFLKGLQQRLGCEAQLVTPTVAVGRSSIMTRRQALLAWTQFRRLGVDLIVRFTDADARRWQDVQRHELDLFPADARSILVCGVADTNTEQWLGLHTPYVARRLGVEEAELRDPRHRTERIKGAITAAVAPDSDKSDVVASLVKEAPADVFRQWLTDAALRTFVDDCRAAALRADCPVPAPE